MEYGGLGVVQLGGRRSSRAEKNGDVYNQNSLYEILKNFNILLKESWLRMSDQQAEFVHSF